MSRNTTQRFVEEWALDHDTIPEYLDAKVRKAMSQFASIYRCAPGKGTAKVRFMPNFDIWNWRKVVIQRCQNEELYYNFLLVLLYKHGDLLSPTHLASDADFAIVNELLEEYGLQEYDGVCNHIRNVCVDKDSGEFDTKHYNTTVWKHYLAVRLLQSEHGYAYLAGQETELRNNLYTNFHLAFCHVEVLGFYMDTIKEPNGIDKYIRRVIGEVLSYPGRSGPESRRQAASACV